MYVQFCTFKICSQMPRHQPGAIENQGGALDQEKYPRVWRWSRMIPIIMHMNVSVEETGTDLDPEQVLSLVHISFLLPDFQQFYVSFPLKATFNSVFFCS